MKNLIISAVLAIFLFGCDGDSDNTTITSTGDGKVHVLVVDENGLPLEDINLFVEDDDEPSRYNQSRKTDLYGEAVFDKLFRDDIVQIAGQNRYSQTTRLVADTTYRLLPTPRKMRQIGSVISDNVHIVDNNLVSLSSEGIYQCVTVDSQGFHAGVTHALEWEQPTSSIVLDNSVLWVTYHLNGIVAYDISDPFQPVLLARYPIFDAYCSLIDCDDSLLVVQRRISSSGRYFIDLYRRLDSSGIRWLSRIEEGGYNWSGRLIESHFVLAGPKGLLFYEISDPTTPVLSSSFINGFSGKGYFFDSLAVIISDLDDPNKQQYDLYTLSNPAAPVNLMRLEIPFSNVEYVADPRIMFSDSYFNIDMIELTRASTFEVIGSVIASSVDVANQKIVICGTKVYWVD